MYFSYRDVLTFQLSGVVFLFKHRHIVLENLKTDYPLVERTFN